MYKNIALLFIFFQSITSFAQEKLICDSLLNKDYDFWYSKADMIFQGQVIKIKERKNFSTYTIIPTRAFAGVSEEFVLRQARTPNLYNFTPDSSYIIFVFEKYRDAVFTPCVLFGIPSRMESVIALYENYCGTGEIKENCNCTPYYDPVCGCDGYNYKNPCEAVCDGVYDYFRGPCYSTTPIRVKPENE